MEHAEPISIVIPAYNEEAAIGDDLDTILEVMDASGYEYEVIVVDDGSRDGTAEVVRRRSRVQLIEHPRNRGVGAARKTGVRRARGNIIVMTDGDGTYPNRDIPRLLAEMESCDMVVGARTREAGTTPWLRKLAKGFMRWLACYLLEAEIPDLNSGLRAMRRELIERYWHILPNSHSWVSTITMAALADDYRVNFIPIDYFPRRGGRSSFHPLTDTYNYILLIIRTVMYFNPLKVLLPICILILGVAFIRQVVQMCLYGLHIFGGNVILLWVGIDLAVIALLADLIVRRVR